MRVAVSELVCVFLVILAFDELQVEPAGKPAKQVTSKRKEQAKGLVTNNWQRNKKEIENTKRSQKDKTCENGRNSCVCAWAVTT